MNFEIPKQPAHHEIRTVTIGALPEQGGTRTSTVRIGGTNAMPFYLFEGEMPHSPVIAMEVFDVPPKRLPAAYLEIFGDKLDKPGEMAKMCVEKFSAEMISIRLDGTHPDKGNRSADQAVETVRQVLESVGVPLIITGHAHFDKINDVMRKVAEATAGENCLINWVEKDNYKTITACCLAHHHCIVAQSPIDVNIAKQLNIQLIDMSFPADKIVMDPMSSAVGYGLEYSYSIMERIRLSGLAGDDMLRMPMLITPGYESAMAKESWAPQSENPEWGDEKLRSVYWEITTATSLLLAGAELMIMYYPQAVEVVRNKIKELVIGKIV
ncbi:acetyl-CoA decarbonylase/synthase complex subunit delta [candidate division KSB1 bacterium]|nr:acetyl-CoA decarbonylase/synthase complex subunit delta [candidate division KSB1 bacterium]